MSRLRRIFDIPFGDGGIQADAGKFETLTLATTGLKPIPQTLQKKGVVREHNNLSTILTTFSYFVDGAVLPKGILTVKWVVEYYNLVRLVGVMRELG